LENSNCIKQAISSGTNSNILHLRHLLNLASVQNVFVGDSALAFSGKIFEGKVRK